MKFTIIFIVFLLFLEFFETFSHPLPPRTPNFDQSYQDYDAEDRRRRKQKRRRRPCGRSSSDDQNRDNGRLFGFLGHDLTFVLGDVTLCGNFPQNDEDNNESSGGIYEGVVPVLQRPTHRPHRPFRPNRPSNTNKPFNSGDENQKPVVENSDDYVQDNYYRPGNVVGALNNQVDGYEQNLSNFSPTKFLSTFSRHFNKFVNPWVDLFFK